jgi:hypothetical protein
VNVQDPEVPTAVNVQVCAEPDAGVAVSVTVAPSTKSVKLNVGVSSAVLLSVPEVPKSDPLAKSGMPGT